MKVIRAAGGLLWRDDDGARRVAVIHRPHRKDWSLPKGKLRDGEAWEQAALREVQEETGCEARILSFAGVAHYVPRHTPKVVLYWNMALVREGPLEAQDEVDRIAWLVPAEALDRLDHDSDREILEEALDPRGPRNGSASSALRAFTPFRAAVGAASLACAGALALSLWLGPPGAGWLLLTGGACGGLIGGAVSLLLAIRRRD
jgi:8-oxo-dGTP diphosphatase